MKKRQSTRPKARRLLATVLVAAALPLGVAAQASPAEASQTARQIAAEVTNLDPHATPATWLPAHPGEKLELYNGPQMGNDTEKWCARAQTAHGAWTRTTYFYAPQPPADDALSPESASPRQILESTCQLGLLFIEVPETNATRGVALLQAVEAALDAQFGAGKKPTMINGFGSAGWTEVRTWESRGATITAAYDQFGGQGRRALVRMAFANSDAIHDLAAETESSRVEQRNILDELLRRIAGAEMPPDTTAEMTSLLNKPDFFEGKNLPRDTDAVAVLRHWIATAKSQPPAQHAMALLAADCVLDFLDHNGVQMGDAARAQLGELGAPYVPNELAGGPVYAHGLLQAARKIAPAGPAATAVLLVQMERGFDETGMCSAGEEEFAQVIKEGEALLSGGQSLSPESVAAVHFMVAEAYTTIVWLGTTESDYHDRANYQPRVESARGKALQHYRAALRLEHGTARSHAAWREAWRLAAGLAPTSGRYFCIYD